MILHDVLKRSERLISNNAPIILTAVGVIGTVTTAVFAADGSLKAAEVLRTEQQRRELETPGHFTKAPTIDKWDTVKLTWKLYVPAVTSGSTTIFAIICANRISTKRAAAMAAAYSISEGRFKEYRDKVTEKLGIKKETEVRDELAEERVRRNPYQSNEVIITGNGDVLCYDEITGRYFESNAEALRKAENEVNNEIIRNMYVSLSEFYDKVGLSPTKYSNEVGWNTENMCELYFTTTMSSDQRPCIAVNYSFEPVRNFDIICP